MLFFFVGHVTYHVITFTQSEEIEDDEEEDEEEPEQGFAQLIDKGQSTNTCICTCNFIFRDLTKINFFFCLYYTYRYSL